MNDDDLIRRGDALDCFIGLDRIGDVMDEIAALPAALAASQPADPVCRQPVKAKPLVWEFEQDGVQVANTSTRHQGRWVCRETEEAAKAAAKADYEARILAAIEPAPVTLAEALKVISARLDEAHRQYTVSIGRDPEKYSSQFSQALTGLKIALRTIGEGEA